MTAKNQTHSKLTALPHPVPLFQLAPGARVSRALLRRQAATFLQLASTHETDLEGRGWTPAMTAGIAAALEQFEQALRDYAQQRDANKSATGRYQNLLEDTRAFREELVAALRLVSQPRPEMLNDIRLRLKATSAPAQLAGWLNAVQPSVEKLRRELAAHFPADPLELVQLYEQRLLQAIGAQAALRRTLPALNLRQLEARSALAAAIERLRLAATVTFARNQSVRRQFRKGFGTRRRSPVPSIQPEATNTLRALPAAAEAAQSGR